MSETETSKPEPKPSGGEEQRLCLRVTEALPRDVGKSVVRLDPKDLTEMGARVGDVLEVQGKRVTLAKALPTFTEARGKRLVQIDGITRGNAAVGIDEKVWVKKARPVQMARRIVLAPASGATALRESRDWDYVGRLLDGLPVVEGDRLRATLFGSRFQDFTVLQTVPKGYVVIGPETLLEIAEAAGEKLRESRISYEDIGGLQKPIQRLREMVELPLKYPQVFERLGVDAPKGVLLMGPPGCGKTLLARAVAHETDASFFAISGPEVIHKFYGESEARLREIFEQAKRRAPSIIFLDELDSIAPKREHVVGDVEKRVVAQLLALMDGLQERGKIVVIGATNLPNLLDPALRRPGRFDREIEIGIPDARARLQILEIHTRGMPLAEDVSLAKLAETTHGFTGADLSALCREAAMAALRRILPKIEFQQETIPYELLLELRVTTDDFAESLREVEPSALRELAVEIPQVPWADVGGLEEVKERLIEAVEWPLQYAELFARAGIKPPKGLLLYGPPGTGKTLLAKALATRAGVNFISIKGPQLLSKYVGESERGVREVFKKGRLSAPCIIFLDEIDSLAPVRGGVGDSHVTERVVSQLLTEMDGIEELLGICLLAATNRLDLVDGALLRPGRFELLLELPVPDAAARLQILNIHSRHMPLAEDVRVKELVERTQSMTGADLEALCRQAAMAAMREFLRNQKTTPLDYSGFQIRAQHFESALAEKESRPTSGAARVRSK